jgi:RNA polymerase sigma-70 factor, ECF subfamily
VEGGAGDEVDVATSTEGDDEEERSGDIADVSAFSLVYERYRLPVFRYLRARGVGDEDALDLTAVTFERAFAARHRFRPRDGGLGAWLFRIARNAAIDAHRHRGPEPVTVDHELTLRTDDTEARRELLDAVAALPAVQRDAIRLRYAGGLSAREIGTVLGHTEAAIQKQIQRGIQALREALE